MMVVMVPTVLPATPLLVARPARLVPEPGGGRGGRRGRLVVADARPGVAVVVAVRRPVPVVALPRVRVDGDLDLDVHVDADVHTAARADLRRHVRLAAHAGVDGRALVPAVPLGAVRGRTADQREHRDHADRGAGQPHPTPGGRSPTAVQRYPSELPTLRHGLHTPLGSRVTRVSGHALRRLARGSARTGLHPHGAPLTREGRKQSHPDQNRSHATMRDAPPRKRPGDATGTSRTARRRGRAVRRQEKRSSRRPVTARAYRPRTQWRRWAISTFSSTPTASGTRIAAE